MTPLEVDALTLTAEAALGAELAAWVGEEADVLAWDPWATEGVRMAASALGLEVEHEVGAFAELRVEEGVVHAGGLEAAEATVGWKGGEWGEWWVGRGDLGVTLDRAVEAEDLGLSTRPVVSRAALPLHASGVGGELGWEERVEVAGGAAWSSSTADAPWLWARLEVAPLGERPERLDAPVEGLRGSAGAGAAWLRSAALGEQRLLTGDLSLRFRAAALDVAALHLHTPDAPDRLELWAQAGTRLARAGEGDLHLLVRQERVTGLAEGERARWLTTGRLAWRSADLGVVPYLHATVSRETGSGVAAGEDAVGLGAERANDVYGAGMLLRF